MRLADRRGLLTGRRLSPVSDLCVQYLMLADSRDRTETFFRDFKIRLGAAHPDRLATLFPEWFRDAATEEEAIEDGYAEDGEYDVDRVDDSMVHWRAPSDEDEHAEVERLLREAMAKTDGTITAAELDRTGA